MAAWSGAMEAVIKPLPDAAPEHQVAVVGLGYIGLPTAAVLASYGWSVCGVDVSPRLSVLRTVEPAGRKAGVKVGSVAELIQKLKDEAGVI